MKRPIRSAAHAEGQEQEHKQHGANLAMPAGDTARAIVFGLVDDVVEVVTNFIH